MFDILFIPVVIVVIFCFQYWLYGKYMFVVFSDKSYILFNIAFKSYRLEVIHNKKSYDRYVDDFCIQHTSQVPDLLNKHGIVVSSNKKNCIKNRVQKLLETRPELVVKYFQESTFTFKDYKQMVEEFNTTYPVQKLDIDLIEVKQKESKDIFVQKEISNKDTKLHFEEKLKLAKDYILQCYSIDGDRHLGDRTFGYLIKAKLIKANTLKERLAAWHNLITADIKPSNVKLFRTPNLSRSKSKVLIDKTLIENLEKIQSFFNEIGLNDVANIVGKDIEKEWSKTK